MEDGEYIRIKDGYLEIRSKLGPGERSSTGRTLVVASSRGNKEADGQHNGKTVMVGFNAYHK
jgi:hypothetical protein